ncbi:MAG TPA: hypothetical protein VMS76_00250, partial [Planctomycetota bacterium]|nr:hypothetical protein [Planctomycetota bacterium]
LEQEDLPKDQRELEKKLRAAEKALAEAGTAFNKSQLSGELALLKARDKVAELEKPEGEEPGGESSPPSHREDAP